MKAILSLLKCILTLVIVYFRSRLDAVQRVALQEKIKAHKKNVETKKNEIKKIYSAARNRLRRK